MATFGYLESAYLVASYLSQVVTQPYSMQSQQQIASSFAAKTQMARLLQKTDPIASQLNRRIVAAPFANNVQIDRKIVDDFAIPLQISRIISTTDLVLEQINQKITSESPENTQLARQIAAADAVKGQISRFISATNLTKEQIDQKITLLSPENTQLTRQISFSKSTKGQLDRNLLNIVSVNQQLDRRIESVSPQNTQFDRQVPSSAILKAQLDRRIEASFPAPSQMSRLLNNIQAYNSEMGRGPVSHETCGGYLFDAYLTTPYLGPQICAHLRQSMGRQMGNTFPLQSQMARRLEKDSLIKQQLERRITDDASINSQNELVLNKTYPLSAQLERKIESSRTIKQQLERKIFGQVNIRAQLLRSSSYKLQSQFLRAIYNTTNLRILCDFPSRGTSGTNWTVIAGGTTAGDFDVNNVNTDIVEQAYRSSATSITIQCDTQISQGIFNDTLAILAHNMSRSASVTLQGSNDITFSSIPLTETLSVEEENIYWISEFLPLTSYRYWRIVASDPTNAAGYIQMGTIVFGPSIIFNGECFVDTVTRKKTHFADRIRTEGYSAVSNDRALKRAVGLSFRKLNFSRENYGKLSAVIDFARTSLKCLWIPTPETASRFSVFGKLAEMPVETHKAISATADYIDLDINIDEAL